VTREHVQLYDASREVRVRVRPSQVDVLVPGSGRYERYYRGGWKGRFRSVFGVPVRYHGNYAGWEARGGVDALDRAAQRHDLGYDRHGRLDAATDGRMVVDSVAAAVNPANDMSPTARVKAAGAAAVFALVPSVQRVGIGDLKVPVPVVGAAQKVSVTATKAAVKGAKKVLKKLF
jgi:hypothetical protein